MAAPHHRRQVILFLVAILLPCLLLVVLSLRMIRQERELAEKRAAEEQRRLTNEIRQELLSRLERIRLEEITASAAQSEAIRAGNGDSWAFLVGWLEGKRLVLPWERDRGPQEFLRAVTDVEFARKIQEAEAEQFQSKQLGRAAELYRAVVQAAQHPAQSGYARLLLARVLTKSGVSAEAAAEYRQLLKVPPQTTDEHGVPLALYAASQLLKQGWEHKAVLDWARSEHKRRRWLPPTETFLLRELADRLVEKAPDSRFGNPAQDLQRQILHRVRRLEQALTLQNDFENLLAMHQAAALPNSPEPIWIPYGEELWLVSVSRALVGAERAVVAVQAEKVFESLNATTLPPHVLYSGVQFVTGAGAAGEHLAPNFPNLRVVFPSRAGTEADRQLSLQRWFYLAVLALVLGLTFLGAYFLWRDVRRELRLAELRSQFVSSVSHELKTPLAAIRMFAETLRMHRATDPQTQEEYLDTIVNESERLTRLLNNVLDFSKIEQGKKTYQHEPTVLPDVVRAAARAMRYPLAQQGFQLHVEIENDLPPIRGDADAIEQAILNLLTNAMKYSGESREIKLRLTARDGHAVVQVVDYGVGIPHAEQSRIFQKFYRVPTPENRLIPGTGLGLTLVEHIARAHGGRVALESAPGRGSTFSLFLPLERGG